jgi:hypothetical protein
MEKLKVNIPELFTRDFPFLDKVDFFRRVLYVLLFINSLTLLPILNDLFSYYGLPGHGAWNTDVPIYLQGSKGLLNILSHPATSDRDWVYMIVFGGQLVFLALGFFRILPVLSSIAVYITTANLFLKGGVAFTGGEGLVNIMLFYLMFVHKPKSQGFMGDLQNIVNNTFYWIMLLQICVLYLFSGMYKLFDQHWMDGTAVMYVSRIEVFSSGLVSLFKEHYWLSAIATYSVIFYQLFFAFAVWTKKYKIPFLIYGVVFHLLISFGMGIFNFGWIMIVMYLLFLDDNQLEKLKSFFRRKKRLTETA